MGLRYAIPFGCTISVMGSDKATSEMSNRQALAHDTIVGGDYKIVRVLGAGGFGITYLARDTKLNTDVAIKEYFPASLAYREDGLTVSTLPSQGGADYQWGLERFLAEAQTLARLRHPNIVRVSRYFKENNTAYMVLGFVEGQDLEGWLNNLGRKPTQAELDKIVGPLLDALTTVHKADVVHRDIKPQNIYIRENDGSPILLDFGAARQALGEHSRATAAFVSPGYSPPESHLNDPSEQGPWTDIYGLAATLYRALVSKPPAQVLSRVSHDNYVPLAAQLDNASEYRAEFLSGVDTGMRVKREERPKSVAAWKELLFSANADQATVLKSSPATVLNTPSRADAAATVVRRTPSDSTGATTVGAPPSGSGSSTKKWAIAASLVLVAGIILYQVYSSFESSPAPSRQQLAERFQQPNNTPPMPQFDNDTNAQQATAANSLLRMAAFAWIANGRQNGFWTGGVNGSNGTGLNIGCGPGTDQRRDSFVELDFIPTGNNPITGRHQVNVQIGNYSGGAELDFVQEGSVSHGRVQASETDQDAGQFLNFLHEVFSGQTMALQIPDFNYQETFNLAGAEEALRPCFGGSIQRPWEPQPQSNGVRGATVRNAQGGRFTVRCDAATGSRGNAVIAFSAQSPVQVQSGQNGTVTLAVDSQTVNLNFTLNSKPDVVSGFLFHVNQSPADLQALNDFVALLSSGNQLQLSSNQLRINETFSLTGSSRALSGCGGL